jgi:hypothetical protein
MEYRALHTHLLRERNKVTHALTTAAEVIEDALQRVEGKPHAEPT